MNRCEQSFHDLERGSAYSRKTGHVCGMNKKGHI